MLSFVRIAHTVYRILNEHEYHPQHIDIYMDLLTKQDFDKTHVENGYVVNNSEISGYGVIKNTGGWRCVLTYGIIKKYFPKIPTVKDKHLETIIDELAAEFRLIDAPLQGFQIELAFPKKEFENKFSLHPDLSIEYNSIQASKDIADMYCVIIIMPMLDIATV